MGADARVLGQVSALDVERTLLGHEDVEEAAVVGVPHPTRGEAIVAVVTVRGGAARGDAEALKRFCAENGAPEKVRRRCDGVHAWLRSSPPCLFVGLCSDHWR